MHNRFVFPVILLLACSCSSKSIKKKINEGGNIMGQTTGEFVSGVRTGIEKPFQVKIEVPEYLQQKGVSMGKILVLSDSLSRVDNRLSVYLIFNQDLKEELTCKAFDAANLEMRRSRVTVDAHKGDAAFYDFIFDKRTDIQSDSRIVIE